jgi:hypothetical protein
MTQQEDEAVVIELMRAKHPGKPPRDPNKQWPYWLIHFNDLRPGTKSGFIVDGVIPCSGLVAVWGPPKSGKSFWTFDLVLHIALGWKYRGRRVEQGPVVYLAFEGGAGFHNRAEAFRRTNEIKGEVWFHLLASNAKLVRDHKALIESIDGQMDPPTVVVLDTLNRSIDGSESKDADMGAYLAAAEAIIEAFDCVVIIVHHCGVDGTRPRGHTSLTGVVDAQIAVKRDANGNIVAEIKCMKDGAEGASFVSALKVVEVGTDDHGQAITSCAIVPVEGAPAAKPKGPKLSGVTKLAYEQLIDVLADVGERPPASNHIPQGPDIRICPVRLWRDHFYSVHPGAPDKPDTKAKAFVRAFIKLQELHLIGVWQDSVWLAGQNGQNGQNG